MLNESVVEFQTYEYRITDKNIINEYRTSVAEVFMFIKKLKPLPTLQKCGRNLLVHQHYLFNLCCDILKERSPDLNFYIRSSYEDLMQSIHITPRPFNKNEAYYKNIWGPMFWRFLHLTSILSTTLMQIEIFAFTMLNFNLCLICPECAYNFKAKNPFKLMMNISLSQDPTTNMYNFHNIVNEALKKEHYPFEQFLKDYKLEAKERNHIKIIYLE
ncbi:Ac92 [Macrobrachium rosenbergii nudivirus]|nr:Ac92 [Macrobrachium rosenbergii nudivirus]